MYFDATLLDNKEVDFIIKHYFTHQGSDVADFKRVSKINADQQHLDILNDFLKSKGVSTVLCWIPEAIWAFPLFNVGAQYVEITESVVTFDENYRCGQVYFDKYAEAILRRGQVSTLRIGASISYKCCDFLNIFKIIIFTDFVYVKTFFWQTLGFKFANIRKIQVQHQLTLQSDEREIEVYLSSEFNSIYSYPLLIALDIGEECYPNHVDNGVVYKGQFSYFFRLVEANKARLQSAVALYLSMSKWGFPKDLCRMFSCALVFWTDRRPWEAKFKKQLPSKPNAIVFEDNNKHFKKLLAQQNRVTKAEKTLESNLNMIEMSRSKTRKLEERTESIREEFESEQKKLKSSLSILKK